MALCTFGLHGPEEVRPLVVVWGGEKWRLTRCRLAKAIGTTQEQIMDNLVDIDLAMAIFWIKSLS